jgi:hypothetical protein
LLNLRALDAGNGARCVIGFESGRNAQAFSIEELECFPRPQTQHPQQVMTDVIGQCHGAVGGPGPWAPDPGSAGAPWCGSVRHQTRGVKSRVEFELSNQFSRSPA